LLNWYEVAILLISAVSAVSALVAVCVTWRESRRNNSVVLDIQNFSSSWTEALDENNAQPFAQLRVVIRNYGMALHRMKARLTWIEKRGWGLCSIALRRQSAQGGRNDVFAKGMVAQFGLKSYELGADSISFLSTLEDPAEQKARLEVFSQGYLAQDFRIGGALDRMKGKWNSWAFRFNRAFDRRMGRNETGVPVVKTYRLLPLFRSLSFHVTDFIRMAQPRPDGPRDAKAEEK